MRDDVRKHTRIVLALTCISTTIWLLVPPPEQVCVEEKTAFVIISSSDGPALMPKQVCTKWETSER